MTTMSRTMLLRSSAAVVVMATLVTLGQPGASRAADLPLRLAMHDSMPMQQQGSPGSMGMDAGMEGMPLPRRGAEHGMGGMPGMTQPGGTGPPTTPEPRGGMGMQRGTGGGAAPLDPMSRMMMRAGPQTSLDHIEGRLAFLRAELRIAEQQAAAWEEFAQALRSARQHLVEARDVLQMAGHANHTPTQRLKAYERHLAARLEAVRAARDTFERLYGTLDQSQRQTAAELVVPFVESF